MIKSLENCCCFKTIMWTKRVHGERCERKHLLTIEAYAQETIPIEENQKYKDKLEMLAAEAKMNREKEEKALCGTPEDKPRTIEWSRDWRKAFEEYSLSCETHDNLNIENNAELKSEPKT